MIHYFFNQNCVSNNIEGISLVWNLIKQGQKNKTEAVNGNQIAGNHYVNGA